MKFLHVVVAVSTLALGSMLYASMPTVADKAKPAAQADAAEFLIRDARVFDGSKLLPRASVHVRNGLIVAVGPDLAVPKGTQIIDAAGRTLLPGLIDAHVHSWGESRRDALRFGVTTELDMFSDFHQLPGARRERESLAATDRADLWSAGTLATTPGGHGTEYGMAIPTLTTPGEASAWVAARKQEGSDYIKIVREDLHVYHTPQRMPTLDAATSAALVKAAHEQGMLAVVHVSAQEDARQMLRDGADGLVHVFQDAPADPEFVALARERHAFVVPTLTVIAGFGAEQSTIAKDPRIAPWLTSEQKQSLQARMSSAPGNPALIRNARESVRRLRAAGVSILAGTDAPNPNTAHGASLHEELEQLVRAGLSATESLAAATSAPAQRFGLRNRGRIAAGLRADLMLVEGDPTIDITTTRAIVAIWKNGHRVERRLDAEKAAFALKPGVIGAFDAEKLPQGAGAWQPTSDQMMGGHSQVQLTRVADGATHSGGALRISGNIAGGSPWPWAGAVFTPGATPMAAVDASAVGELQFYARGDGRAYTVMLFSGGNDHGMPAMLRIQPTAQWSQLHLRLADFPGADLTHLRAIAITAAAPPGHFQLDIDDVQIR